MALRALGESHGQLTLYTDLTAEVEARSRAAPEGAQASS